MKDYKLIVINFKGGIISPGDLFYMLTAAQKAGVMTVKFGLRQQLFLELAPESFEWMTHKLAQLKINFQTRLDDRPNIVSSYPAEGIFITNTWLSEGVYKDVFDNFDFHPRLKVNICDSKQSFTPMLTGNINWVADPVIPHYWNCLIRFPRTNKIYESRHLVYTNDLARMTSHIESIIIDQKPLFYRDGEPVGELLFAQVLSTSYLVKPANAAFVLPSYNLPYYEGLNRYNNKYWLGIYRRDESFPIDFLIDTCLLCLEMKIGQLCATPWKSIIIKSIDEKNRMDWNALLNKYQVNVRHAANELNFQVEDNCAAGLALKQFLVKSLNEADIRTFGICFGIKTRRKSEVFSSILVRRKPWFSIFGLGFFHTYDILCADEFNPNKRTGFVFSKNNPKWVLAEQLRRAVVAYYHQLKGMATEKSEHMPKKELLATPVMVYQCATCLSVYDRQDTPFEEVDASYCCPLCESPKDGFKKTDQQALGLLPV
ncbi:rubredoxin [Flavihumibacter fluvii]|uniref:rubredoxin n=1 Tax=Flavihumibacter fluvii TaxID=2838157 RepID=UPI001BDEF926|nr:rubredoxin [Flavihumibacter fluvii]ULQ52816.1 rubredoxin [Flavihumibacter fluvii]